jgi:hypothetical protein
MRLHQILFVLLTMRLLMPPGICACKWSSPAARLLVAFFDRSRADTIPPPPVESDDDHTPGCPASFLAVGMGVWPPSEPPPSLVLAPETLSLPNASVAATPSALPDSLPVPDDPSDPLSTSLYLSHCALRI